MWKGNYVVAAVCLALAIVLWFVNYGHGTELKIPKLRKPPPKTEQPARASRPGGLY